jgi:hypothetical protein
MFPKSQKPAKNLFRYFCLSAFELCGIIACLPVGRLCHLGHPDHFGTLVRHTFIEPGQNNKAVSK